MLICTRTPSIPWEGQRSKLVHDSGYVLLWAAHEPFLMAAWLSRDKCGSPPLSRPEAVTTLSVVDQAEL